ncbi:MAG: hypothetical protein E6980_10080 [Clostridium sp.]|uniref:hypothetical protein n=1 Tax=Clostridium sp. TaxID=1506 RepID=UPI002902C59A|nr:hypothetical protein [Clostridium sp.]MDU1230495.1 hypothetical protein [Clostridium sp.]
MIKYYKVSIIILSLICLIGCHNIKFKKYDDKNLSIGIIGAIPKVREDNIAFNKIGFEDLEEENILKNMMQFLLQRIIFQKHQGENMLIFIKNVEFLSFLLKIQRDMFHLYMMIYHMKMPIKQGIHHLMLQAYI